MCRLETAAQSCSSDLLLAPLMDLASSGLEQAARDISPETIGRVSCSVGALADAVFSFGKPVFIESGDNDAVAETNETPTDLVLVSPKFEGLAW